MGISNIVSWIFGQLDAQAWRTQIAHLLPDMTLEEVRDYLWADTDEQQASLLEAVYTRLGITPPTIGLMPQRVRMMTMHGAKGLSARVVFIPGLEEGILPGSKRKPYPGLILEAARMLYVSITRSCAACILSYADKRAIYGKYSDQTHARFVTSLAGGFGRRSSGLTTAEVQRIVQVCGNL
jgi:superfamily I DNA/RNA helicase